MAAARSRIAERHRRLAGIILLAFHLRWRKGHAALLGPQPSALRTRLVEAGYFFSIAAGRIGRAEKLPPQFGQTPPSTPSAQSAQKVHSNVQINASVASGGRSLSQHSQFGRRSSIPVSSPD